MKKTDQLIHLTPCLSGEIIAKVSALRPYFNALKQLISAPEDIYAELYLTTLHRFCEFCQAMPAMMTQTAAQEPYGLLKQQLNLTIATLKLRRGKMLPPNSDSETIAAQEPLWTYAIFTASLLAYIQHIQTDRTIELYKDKNDLLGTWHPLADSLYEPNTHYLLLAQPHHVNIHTCEFRAALIGKIIPSVALRWLADSPEVFTVWWEAMVEEKIENVLTRLIQEAAEKINYAPLSNTETTSTTESHQTIAAPTAASSLNQIHLLKQLLEWLPQH